MQLMHTQCCGMRELDCVGGRDFTAEQALEKFLEAIPSFTDYGLRELRKRPQINFSLVTFTGVVQRVRADQYSGRGDNYGQAFADLIVKEGLGEVVAGPVAVNPNTQNHIRCWVWRIDRDAVERRAQAVLDKRLEAERKKADDTRRTQAAGGAGTYGDLTQGRDGVFRLGDARLDILNTIYWQPSRPATVEEQQRLAQQVLGEHNNG